MKGTTTSHQHPVTLIKCFFRGTVKTPETSRLPQWLGLHLQDVHPGTPSPVAPLPRTPARPRATGGRPGSRARCPKKPVCTPAATSPAAFCLLILWERLLLRAQQSSPELAPATYGEDLVHDSPAARAAQASWPCANAVDFAYGSTFSLQEDFHMRRQLFRI